MPRPNRQKLKATIEGYMTGRPIGASELCIAAMVLDGALEQLEAEAAEMLAQLRAVRDARGPRELEQTQTRIAELLRRIDP